MDDIDIIELYFKRDQAAIGATDEKYGRLCHGVAVNILTVREDAEECVNDTYMRAWDAIPPERPARLGNWLCRVVRNLALDRWRRDRRQKRYAGVEIMLDELAECLPAPGGPESALEGRELTGFLDRWLESLPEGDRRLFLRRYWRGEEVRHIAESLGTTPQSAGKRLFRLRRALKAALEKEGYTV